MAAGFDLGSVTASFKADLTDFKKGMDDAKSQVNGFKDNLGNVASGIADFGKQAAVFTGIVAAGVGVFLKSSVDDFEKWQDATTQLETHLKSTGGAAGVTADSAIKLAESLAQVTRFSQTTIVTAEGVLSTFQKIGKDVFPGATEAVLNMATAFGLDTTTAAKQLGKALEDPISGMSALHRFGVVFTADQKKAITAMEKSGNLMGAQKLLLDQLGTSFGGSARAAGGTFGGQMDILNNKFTAIKISIGEAITQGLEPLLQKFNQIVSSSEFQGFINTLTTVYIPAFVSALTKMGEWIASHQDLVLTFLKGVGIAVAALLVIGTITALVVALTNPLVLVSIAIAALFTAWQTNFWGIRDITNEVGGFLVNLFNNIISPAIHSLVTDWMAQWVLFSSTVQIAWNLITVIFKAAWSIIQPLLKLNMDLMTGNWKGVWKDLQDLGQAGWNLVAGIFNAAVDFIKDWGGKIVDGITQPFKDAWNTVNEYATKIRDAVDPNKRHSPSMVDRVKQGVSDLNSAFGDLKFNTQIMAGNMGSNPASAIGGAAGISPMGGGITIQIDLSQSIIGDKMAASTIGTQIGDSIITKLKQQIRF